MMWHDYGLGLGWGAGWSGFGVFGMIHMVLWWVLIIVLIVFLLKWIGARTRDRADAADDSALKILRERFARGEIDREEFEQRKRDLAG